MLANLPKNLHYLKSNQEISVADSIENRCQPKSQPKSIKRSWLIADGNLRFFILPIIKNERKMGIAHLSFGVEA